MAAIMILSKHIKRDIQCLEQQSTLLDTRLENFELVGSSNTLEGAYLYFDCNEGKWIRSGKCTAGGFTIQHRQHLKSSNCQRSTLQFYNLYPSRDRENQSSFRRGYFENLAQYVAIGFDSTKKESMDIMVRDIDDGGIFLFTKEEYQKIEKLNLRGRTDLPQKVIDMVAHLCEMTYNLCIAPLDCVSSNLGFESVLGQWKVE